MSLILVANLPPFPAFECLAQMGIKKIVELKVFLQAFLGTTDANRWGWGLDDWWKSSSARQIVAQQSSQLGEHPEKMLRFPGEPAPMAGKPTPADAILIFHL